MLLSAEFRRRIHASVDWEVPRLLRTITAACAEFPFADLIAQTCATMPVSSTVWVGPQRHVLALEVIGFVLP